MEGNRGGSRVFVVALPTLVHMAWAVLPPVADERTDVPEGLLAVHLRAGQLFCDVTVVHVRPDLLVVEGTEGAVLASQQTL